MSMWRPDHRHWRGSLGAWGRLDGLMSSRADMPAGDGAVASGEEFSLPSQERSHRPAEVGKAVTGVGEDGSGEESLAGATYDARATTGPRAQGPVSYVREGARDVVISDSADVVVVGGGPAGTAAAVSAGRVGVSVILVERYNHLGGLATGGLVLWIDRMTDWAGELVIAGFAKDVLGRLPPGAVFGPSPALWGSTEKAANSYWAQRANSFRGVVTWSPLVDPEWLKYVSLEMVVEAGALVYLHTWGATPIVDGNHLRGVILESKEGRHAILGKVVIDATGDGDIYARAGAEFHSDIDPATIHHCMNVAWIWGGVDMEEWWRFRAVDPEGYDAFIAKGAEILGTIQRPHASWRKDVALFMGPRLAGYSALDVTDLSAVELESRRRLVAHLSYFREHAPGFGDAWILLSAPQIGVRHARRLVGVETVNKVRWRDPAPYEDEIAVSPSLSPGLPNVSIPLGALVPRTLDNLLAPGRHLSCDAQTHTLLREIPQCWATGQAAGVAAGIAVKGGVPIQAVDVADVQAALTQQGAHVRTGGGKVREKGDEVAAPPAS